MSLAAIVVHHRQVSGTERSFLKYSKAKTSIFDNDQSVQPDAYISILLNWKAGSPESGGQPEDKTIPYSTSHTLIFYSTGTIGIIYNGQANLKCHKMTQGLRAEPPMKFTQGSGLWLFSNASLIILMWKFK